MKGAVKKTENSSQRNTIMKISFIDIFICAFFGIFLSSIAEDIPNSESIDESLPDKWTTEKNASFVIKEVPSIDNFGNEIANSINAVGFVNVDAKEGWNLIANPLNSRANFLAEILPDVPIGSIIRLGAQREQHAVMVQIDGKKKWLPENISISPGIGFFIKLPQAQTITFRGEVPQGILEMKLPQGLSFVASMVPQAGTLQDLGFPAEDGDEVTLLRGDEIIKSTYTSGKGFDPLIVLEVGEAFILNTKRERLWTRPFSTN